MSSILKKAAEGIRYSHLTRREKKNRYPIPASNISRWTGINIPFQFTYESIFFLGGKPHKEWCCPTESERDLPTVSISVRQFVPQSGQPSKNSNKNDNTGVASSRVFVSEVLQPLLCSSAEWVSAQVKMLSDRVTIHCLELLHCHNWGEYAAGTRARDRRRKRNETWSTAGGADVS